MILSGAKIHSSSDRAFGCRSQHLRGRTEVRLVDQFWSETVCADAAGAQKAAGLEETLTSVVVRASPQAGPVVASRPRYTQQMIEEPATHASALFLWQYADARQVSQSGDHVPYAILCSPGKGQTHRGQRGFLPLGDRQVCPRESRPGPQSSRMLRGQPRAVGRDPHLDSRVDLDKCRPSIARHSPLSIGTALGVFASAANGCA